MLRNLFLCVLILLSYPASTLAAPIKNGFDLSAATIPVDKIFAGGPPKDGIPAINQPKFVAAADSNLAPRDRVLGLVFQGEARAYPINILNWHEIVNDNISGMPVAVTWCPLCGSGVAFKSRLESLNQRQVTFGVSGLLFNSDVLMYDHSPCRDLNRNTRALESCDHDASLWSQLKGEAVSGPLAGTKLEHVPVQHIRWQDWLARYPNTKVLSQDTGYRRDYNRDPYAGYIRSNQLYFPVDNTSERYHPKEEVVALELNGEKKAWPFVELDKNGQQRFTDQLGGQKITVEWQADQRSARVLNENGQLLPANRMFWFAWVAFNPDAQVFAAKN